MVEELVEDPRIVCVERTTRGATALVDSLFPEERAHVAKAVEKRRREFVLARTLAREAFQKLGREPSPLLAKEDRSPRWPDGLVGSITHTSTWCAVCVAHATDVRGVGIDVEPDEPLKPDLWPRILTPDEESLVRAMPPVDRGLWAKVVFSAKESAYKAQYGVSATFLGFQAMVIEGSNGEFRATLQKDVGPHFAKGHVFHGRYLVKDGLVATLVTF